MHCQHFKKALTTKQKDKAALAKSKKARKPFTMQVRNKKTQCPSRLTLTGQIPTKKQLLATDIKPYLKTHTAVLNISFNHNHPIISGHTLTFRPVSAETKETFLELFSNGHSASSARHTHEQHLLMDAATDELKQYALADRAINPSAQDVCRLFQQWREKHYGKDDGKPLFERLQAEVNKYNAKHREQNGRALLQWYETQTDNYSDDVNSDGESNPPPPKKKKRESTSKPLILAICTPLMARAHECVCQAGELLFCDSTSSMDRFNTSVFVLSTHSVASGIPLGVLLTSDEREETIQTGLQMLKSIFPASAFYGKGSEAGPDVIMIDDSSAERGAITKCWPKACVLLCTFHFLQRQWTWLYEGKNKINKDDRVTLIQEIRKLVNAPTEDSLTSLYDQLLKHAVSVKYPYFLDHLKSLWTKRDSWAHCYRHKLLIRGNYTNNYAEAGIKILKELVFSRVKAYNLVQMFTFIYDIMDMYYQKKRIAISNHRFETYVALRFQGLNAKKVSKASIIEKNGWYKVKSCTCDKYYDVNVNIGLCTCERGKDGSPCVHQAAVVLYFGKESVNYIATLSAKARLKLATIALGNSAIK